MDTFIVKVQISQFSSEPGRSVLIYNEDRSALVEMGFEDSKAIELIGLDPDVPKSYWIATMVDNEDGKDTKTLQLIEQTSDQNW